MQSVHIIFFVESISVIFFFYIINTKYIIVKVLTM